MSPQRGDKGKMKRNAQVIRGHSPQVRLGATWGQKYAIAINMIMKM